MISKKTGILGLGLFLALFQLYPILAAAQNGASLSAKERLGKNLFYDNNLSNPPGQACAACHAPNVGFTGPDAAINLDGGVYEGAVPHRFGNRKPPAAAYAGDSPILHYDQGWVGGMFWDGRATGLELQDPLAEQARGPFLNPLEQNMPNAAAVVSQVAKSSYAAQFLQVWGKGSLDVSTEDQVKLAYNRIAMSIAAYERSSEVSAFTSKYDHYLKGRAKLSEQELRGLAIFEGKGNCATCHPSRPVNGKPPLFTDYTYDNLGIPKNPMNPFYTLPEFNPDGFQWIDPGLGGFLKDDRELGKQKVPTLRNVDKRPFDGFVKAYGHNGYFKSLESIVHFYNTRDVSTGVWAVWPPPEYAATVNTTDLGNLGLTLSEEADLVAFLKTLSDGYNPSR